MARRMFVALYPPQRVVSVLSAALAEAKRGAAGEAAGRGAAEAQAVDAVRWSDPAQWHLTLAFLPKVEEVVLPALSEALAGVAADRAPAPTLEVAGAGHFGGTALWWALRRDEGVERWLTQLSRQVRRECRAVGAATDDNRFRPHITIGRVRRDAPRGTAVGWVSTLEDVTSDPWIPQELVLVTSVTGPVVTHTATGRWHFASDG